MQARSVWKALNYPIFIPEGDQDIVAHLLSGDAGKVAEILKRRASLGSGSAGALLGFLELMGALRGEPEPAEAIACCTAPAKAGDPFAQYVLSCAYWEEGKRKVALRWMTRSAAESKFLPAWVGLGSMLLTLAENDAELRDAIKILWRAHKLGHIAALPLICETARRGRLGRIARLLGTLSFPYAILRGSLVIHCEPFAVRAFVCARKPRVPFFSKPMFESGF